MSQDKAASTALLRQRGRHDSARVGMIELFFDLVFVFAVTQLSHALLANMTLAGLLQISLLLLALWWVWIYTSWMTNWLDPERIQVRVSLLVLMLAGLLLSASIPQAFAARGVVFAGAYVFMQVGRTLFFLWAVRGASKTMTRTFQRILAWFCLSGIFWIAGALVQEEMRFMVWALALSIDVAAPSLSYWVPGLGRSTTAEWNIQGEHLAERCALFVIIALGESLLVTGATFAQTNWDWTALAAFVLAVIGSILLWWIYFDTAAQRAQQLIHHSEDPGRQGRTAYTYIHVLIVAGIIVCAVADEILLVHPGHATPAGYAAILGGPACYLLGNALFKWTTGHRKGPPLSHLIGLLLIATLTGIALAYHPTSLVIGAGATATLAVVAVWESLAGRRPSPFNRASD